MDCLLKIDYFLLQVVSEEDGYPAEMLELSMEHESGLRKLIPSSELEIFGGHLPSSPNPEMSGHGNPNDNRARTLAEIRLFVGEM